MDGIWGYWEVNLKSKYYVESITDSFAGFRIILSEVEDELKKLEILFEDSVHAYRSTDESFRQRTIHELDQYYGTEFYRDRTFFKVTNSEYMKWLTSQSFGIADSESIQHFSILAVDSIVDIIAAYEPKITILY